MSRLLRFEIEFFLRSHDQPDGKTIRRNSGQFASEKDVETYGLLKAHLRRTASEFGRMVCCEKRSRSVPTQKPTARLDVESAACRLPPRVRFGFGGGKSIRPIYFSPASTRGLFFCAKVPPPTQPTARLRFESVGLPPMPELCAVPSDRVGLGQFRRASPFGRQVSDLAPLRRGFSNVHPP